MALPETTTQSFIVRIWLEETAEEDQAGRWRGHITHVPSHKRRYFEDLNDVIAFIVPYLEAMGFQLRHVRGNSMSSIFSFLRGRSDNPGAAPAAAPAAPAGALASDAAAGPPALATSAETTAVSPAILSLAHSAPSQADVLAAMRAALETYLPPPVVGQPAPNVSIVKVEEKPAGLGNYIGQEALANQFSLVVKGGRLQATARFQLWAATPNDVDQAIDDLHGRLLVAKDDLWIAGFLRFVAQDSPPAEFVSSLNTWRRMAEYDVLYEFRYTDTDDAQSLIARVPVHTDPEEPNSPQRETAVVTDKMARWDDVTAPMLDVRGRQTLAGLSALAFVPGAPPTGPVVLRRTFDGAAGAPTELADLGQWVTAVTDPAAPNRHAQVTFAAFSDFLAAFSPAGDPITLGDWDEDAVLDAYDAFLLEFSRPIMLPGGPDHFQLIYQPGSTDPHFDETAVIYIRSV